MYLYRRRPLLGHGIFQNSLLPSFFTFKLLLHFISFSILPMVSMEDLLFSSSRRAEKIQNERDVITLCWYCDGSYRTIRPSHTKMLEARVRECDRRQDRHAHHPGQVEATWSSPWCFSPIRKLIRLYKPDAGLTPAAQGSWI